MRRRLQRGPKRKLNWDYAAVNFAAGAFGGANDLQATWLRVPAGAFDPVQQRQIDTNCTLTLTQVREDSTSQMILAIVDAGVQQEIAVGIIAWPSIYGDDTIPADVPDPTVGAYPWIWRNHHWLYRGLELMATTDASFAKRTERMHNNHCDALLESRAQRRLPDGVGILAVWSGIDFNMNALNEGVDSTYLDVRMLLKNP